MNFELDDEQTMLRDTTRELLNRSYDAEKRNATSATDEGWNAAVWKQFAELGLLGLPFAEADGGMGAGPVETMVVMTELGRALAPEPYLGGVLIPRRFDRGCRFGRSAGAAPAGAQRRDHSVGLRAYGTRHALAGRHRHDHGVAVGIGVDYHRRQEPVLQGDSAHVVIVSAHFQTGAPGSFW